jgi:hypothetical protein
MKVNRLIALAAIALLAVGTTGIIATRSFAQSSQPPNQAQVTDVPEAVSGPDTNADQNIQEGDQTAPDTVAQVQ